MSTRVGTANIFKGMSLVDAAHGLGVVLAERPDLLALQEWGPNRNSLLNGLKTYRWARSPKGGGPVLYSDRYGLLRTNSRVLSRRSFVGRLPGRKSTLPDNVAGEFVFSDDRDGGEDVVLNFHLDAEVQSGGRYRTDKAHRPRVRRHKRQVRRLERIVARHQGKGRRVWLCGDTNYDGLRITGLVSCWSGQRAQGTLGRRTVDIVFADVPSFHVKTLVTGSDHRAVVATYK